MQPHIAPMGSPPVAMPLYQHRIDGNADKNQQPLKAHGKQGLQIVLPGMLPSSRLESVATGMGAKLVSRYISIMRP